MKKWTAKEVLEQTVGLGEQSDQIVRACSTVLAGHHPAVTGAALAELVGMWIKGHVSAEVQPVLLKLFVAQVEAFIALESPGVAPAGSDPGQKTH